MRRDDRCGERVGTPGRGLLNVELAFGAPGVGPTWSSSAKDLVATALGPSRLWATVGFGILNEVYWPATGLPQIRDLGFIVAGETGWFEVKRVNHYRVSTPAPHVPLPCVVHEGEGYRLTLEFLPAPLRDALLVSYRLEGDGLRLYPLLAPHLGGSGLGNSAWIGDGLYADKGEHALCLLAGCGFARASAGYVGASDGWQDFARHGQMTWQFGRATDGNVALIGELEAAEGVLALAFAESPQGARTLAASALAEGYAPIRARFIEGWERWAACFQLPHAGSELERQARLSATVLKAHEDRSYPGAIVASLSVPWGNTSDDPGGYHLVWTRDAVEAGLALLAVGDRESARRTIAYLAATQAPDGHWPQNFSPDGQPFWAGIQLDEVGFPILFAAKLRELGEEASPLIGLMVQRAAAYLARAGPVSPQDRWEENAGASPFTLAVSVAALVAAAAYWLKGDERAYAFALADCWNERIEEWTYVTGTELARTHKVAGYYVRIGPPAGCGGLRGHVEVANRAGETIAASALVGLDFLYLARLGLRQIDDPRILDTLTVVDALLRVETPNGAAYHRYDDDGYGEHADGSPFDGSGIGRAWPLLTGERGHGALLQGASADPYLDAMARMTGPGGLIPEQVWDSDPIPERQLYPGKPTGSAMPLVWAHAEFLKLLLARDAGRPVEQLDAIIERHLHDAQAATWFWRTETPVDRLAPGRTLVIENAEPFVLHFGFDGWQNITERTSAPLGLGMHGVRLEPGELASHAMLDFTRRSLPTGAWEGADHTVELGAAG